MLIRTLRDRTKTGQKRVLKLPRSAPRVDPPVWHGATFGFTGPPVGFTPRCRAKLAEAPLNLCEVDRNRSEFGHIRPEVGQMFAASVEVGPTLANTWPHLAELDRIRHTLGRVGSRFGRFWSTFDRIRHDRGRMQPKSANSGRQIWTKFARICPMLGESGAIWAEIGPNADKLGQIWPNVWQIWAPNIWQTPGRIWSKSEPKSPVFGRSSTSFALQGGLKPTGVT